MKLELAIIENVQREDLNPIDRAIAFNRLVEEFGFKHSQVAKKIGKSREYVSNTLRLLTLPEEIKQAVADQKISEGHARTLMMLNDRPEEQSTLFKEVIYKHLTVRETEAIARKIAHDKVRKKEYPPNPELVELEDKLSESLGTRVQIERRENGGKITIDFFSPDDVRNILALLTSHGEDRRVEKYDMLSRFIDSQKATGEEGVAPNEGENEHVGEHSAESGREAEAPTSQEHREAEERPAMAEVPSYGSFETNTHEEGATNEHVAASAADEGSSQEDDGLYSVKNFSI